MDSGSDVLLIPNKEELQKAYELVKKLKLPKIPDSVITLQKEFASERPDIDKIVQAITNDISLSGHVLKIINSALYGLPRKIESIKQAAVMLGLDTLRKEVLATALNQSVTGDTEFSKLFWKATHAVSAGMFSLSESLEAVNGDQAYLVGLFQDAGCLLLNQLTPSYHKLYQYSFYRPYSILAQEWKLLGVHHAVIGYLFAKHWELPDTVCMAIYNSHRKSLDDIHDSEVKGLVSSLRIINQFIGHQLFPESIYDPESVDSVSTAYIEVMMDGSALADSLLDLKEHVDLNLQ